MTFRSLCTTGFAWLALAPLGTANLLPSQTAPNPDYKASPSATVQAPKTSAVGAPLAPTIAEMRAMNATQLDEAGDKMRAAKNFLAALDCYREALRRNLSARYYNKIAITEIMLRHPDLAQRAAKKAIRRDKHMAEAWNNLGVALYLEGVNYHRGQQTASSVRYYERAISLDPENASFHNNLAAALMDLKEYNRGMSEYRKAFELDPSFFEHTSQNGISAHLGSPEDRAQFSFVMARLFASSGDTDRALHFLRAAMEDGYPKIDDVYHEKEFAPVLKDERFLALMKDRPVAIR
jgi:tetratricopeptide (TPR) repeat protein